MAKDTVHRRRLLLPIRARAPPPHACERAVASPPRPNGVGGITNTTTNDSTQEGVMASKRTNVGFVTRLDTGAAILAAANEHATDVIKPRLSAFTAVHRRYADTQRKVEEAGQQLQAAQVRVAACLADQDAALAALAGALVADGQPWANPFATFGGITRKALRQLPPTDRAKAVHRLVAEVKRQTTASAAALQRADAAEYATQAIEAALVPLDGLQAALQAARHRRDAVAHTWDNALAALKRGARSAADDGAPGLYAALFGRVTRPTRKKTPSAAPTLPAPAASAPPAPGVPAA